MTGQDKGRNPKEREYQDEELEHGLHFVRSGKENMHGSLFGGFAA